MSAALRIERVDAAHARVAGTLGFDGAAAALARGAALLDGGAEVIELDASGLAGVDSATLAILLAWAARAAERGTRLSVAGAPASLKALATLCGAEHLLGIA